MKMITGKNIRVEYLCSQPLWNFRKVNGKEFCKVCKHHISDFTESEISDIHDVLYKSGGKTCGIFYPDQFVINEQTKRSPALYGLVYASAIAFLSSVFASETRANTNTEIKTEQYYFDWKKNTDEHDRKNYTSEMQDSPDGTADEEPKAVKKRKRGIKLFRIGRRTVYLTKRFPFIKSYRQFKGRICSCQF